MKTLLWSLFFCCCISEASAQQFLVFFRHKGNTTFSINNPAAFLSQRALERRQRYGLVLDSTDLPVAQSNIIQLETITGVTVLNRSKWLNAVSISAPASALSQINNLPFVASTRQVRTNIPASGRVWKPMMGETVPAPEGTAGITGIQENFYSYGRSDKQVNIHKGSFLHNLGLRGNTMMMGILDAGFYQYNTLPAFDSTRSERRILETWDFVARDTSVAEDDAHGMQCFSIIAANMPGTFVGTAPEASFMLYRSEDADSETQVEELNWVCAAERLDSAGGDIISSSLGYNQFDGGLGSYRYADLEGDISITSRGADIAASKGILVVNSAGNEGNNAWRYISTPADGDSVLAVGAIDTAGNIAAFSSYGPSSDGRIKPDVASVGVRTILQAPNGSIATGNGTSFSCPNFAGLAACLWQGFPERNNWEIMEAIRNASTTATAPNNRIGYGIPDMRKATGRLIQQFASASITAAACGANIQWQSKDGGAMRYQVERLDPGSSNFAPIATINAKDAAWGIKTYQLTDRPAGLSGNFTYRIIQVLDTSATNYYAVYLDTISIANVLECSHSQRYSITPNPVGGNTQLKLNYNEAVPRMALQLYNQTGQQIWQQQLDKPVGVYLHSLPTTLLAAGTYYLRIASADRVLTTIELLKL